jgi:hypothetical protein
MTASFSEQMWTIYTYLGMLSREIPSPMWEKVARTRHASEPDEGSFPSPYASLTLGVTLSRGGERENEN